MFIPRILTYENPAPSALGFHFNTENVASLSQPLLTEAVQVV
jgi:hypothetical protein